MKTLRNFIVTGGLLRSNGDEAQVGDTVKIYTYDEVEITGVIQFPIAEVNCGKDRSYIIEYEGDTVRVCDIVDGGVVLDCCALLDIRIDELDELMPDFGPADDIDLQQIFRGVQGLSGDRPLFVASGFTADASPNERSIFGISRDGAGFDLLEVNYTPPEGDGVRDPSWMFWRGRFYIAYTAGNFGGVDYVGIAVSDDFLNWTHLANAPTDTGAGGASWAPEWFVEGDRIWITFSRNTDGGDWHIWQIEATDIENFSTWTSPVLVSGTDVLPGAEIDSHIIKWDGAYLLACRSYGTNGAKVFRSTTSPVSGYSLISRPGDDRTMEGMSLVNMGGGKLRLYFIDSPGGVPNQAYMDSFDGGVTFGSVVATTGTFVTSHMTVLSFLAPDQAAAITPRRTDEENDSVYVPADGSGNGKYGKILDTFVLTAVGGGSPVLTPFTFDRETFELPVVADTTTHYVEMEFFWQGYRSYHKFGAAITQIAGVDTFVNGHAPLVADSNIESLLTVAIPNWADNTGITVNITNSANNGVSIPVTVLITFRPL